MPLTYIALKISFLNFLFCIRKPENKLKVFSFFLKMQRNLLNKRYKLKGYVDYLNLKAVSLK